jgi:3-deoxy-D-arabino-heptulosonate 7-phosphate (DAHP) synthase class II
MTYSLHEEKISGVTRLCYSGLEIGDADNLSLSDFDMEAVRHTNLKGVSESQATDRKRKRSTLILAVKRYAYATNLKRVKPLNTTVFTSSHEAFFFVIYEKSLVPLICQCQSL